jgi:pyrroline-5-carboxylate reductase
MAEAMIAALLSQNLAKPEYLLASGPREERGASLNARYGIRPFTENAAAAREADVVILSVKPQRLEQAARSLEGAIRPDALVLSIVAGASLKHLERLLKHTLLARAMPNTPARIGEGITVWTATPETGESHRARARCILAAMGEEIYVEDEGYLDMATALSGTGPAYVFMFMEAMIDAGVHIGFPRRIAERLVIQTMRGSVDFYEKNDVHVAALRNQVTSPGGTSAEALYYLEKAGFRTAIARAIWAAYRRSLALGENPSPSPPVP